MSSDIDTFIAERVRPDYQAAARSFVALIRKAAPELKPGMRGGTDKYIPVPVWRLTRDVVVMSPSLKGITISFARGAQFDDPGGLLKGAGKTSRTVLIRSVGDVERPEVTALLGQAVALNA